MERLCKIEGCENPVIRKTPQARSIYCSPECKQIARAISYKKWVKNHPERHKEFQTSQYKNRVRDGKARVKNRDRNTPQYPCQRCGKLSDNYFNCPACRKMLSNNIAGDDYIFADGGEDLVSQFSESAR